MLAGKELKAKSKRISELLELLERQQSKPVDRQLQASEEHLRKLNYELNERVKELNCLYGISNLATKSNITLKKVFQGVVELIPPGWQYPEITSARISIADQQFRTQNFKDTIWKQTSDITVHNKRVGVLEVCYLQEKPQSNEGPFLAEERKLINAITEQLGYIIERKRVQEQVQNLAKFPSENPNPVLRITKDGKLLYANSASDSFLTEWNCHEGEIVPENWRQTVSEVFTTGSSKRVEIEHTGRTFAFMVVAILDAGYANLYARDITERKQAQEKIHSLAKFPSENPNPVLRITKDGKLLYANNASNSFLSEWGSKESQTVPDYWCQAVSEAFTSGKQKRFETEYLGRTFSFEITPVFEADYANLYGQDITDRKKTDNLLRQSEKRYRALVENIDLGIALVDADHNIIMANSAVGRLFDCDVSKLVGKKCYNRFEKRQEVCSHCPGEKAMKTGRAEEVETEGVRDDGSHFSVQIQAFPLFDENGEPAGFIEVAGDITKRRLAEETVRQYEHIVSSSTDMLAILDKRFNYLAVNKAYTDAFKLSSEQLVGNTVAKVFGEEFFKTVIKPNADRCLGGEEVNYQDWFDFPACERRYMDITYYPYCGEDNKIIGFVVNGRDITERKQAEEAIRESEKKYHQLVETMNEGLSVSDENYIFTFVNPRFAKILGYPPDEIIGRHITGFFDAENKKIIRIQMTQRRRGEEKSYDITWTGKDGRKIDTIISPRAFFDAKGNYTGSLGMITDITKRKRFERQIVKLNEKLEQTVAERTAKLRNTHKLLLEDIKKRKRLEREIIEISEREKRRIGQELHDSVGQQFTGVAFMTKVLQQRINDKLPEEAAAAAEIVKYVNEAAEQTRDIAKVLHPVDLCAGGLMKALYELAETTEKLFMVSCIFECDKTFEIGDTLIATQLYRITQEAITNAIKHGKAKKIRARLVCNSDKSVLIIKNDGLDFPQEFKARGNGMGLQIMNHRVGIIGGKLDIYKPDEGGTIVTCAFPTEKH